MEEQLDNSKHRLKRTRKAGVVGLGFTILFSAIVGTTWLVSDRRSKPQPAGNAPVAQVQITKDGFVPSTLSVKVGTRIVWTNTDQALHQVASNPYPVSKGATAPRLASEILNNGQTYSYTATKTGKFDYHDQLLPTVNGTIVVQKP